MNTNQQKQEGRGQKIRNSYQKPALIKESSRELYCSKFLFHLPKKCLNLVIMLVALPFIVVARVAVLYVFVGGISHRQTKLSL